MKQSNKITEITNLVELISIRNVIDPAKIAALYVRLSRDDNLEGDSYSIANQKKLLIEIAKGKGYSHLLIFCDDGISGVTMNRPGFQLLLQAVEQKIVSAVFVKDLSRIGRNYIEVGKLTEEVFPEHDIRLVAVSDNLDTDEGESELTPIKNLFNAWYARDISKKRRISNKIKGAAGEPMGQPLYGYMKDPEDKKRIENDPENWAVFKDVHAPIIKREIWEQVQQKRGKIRKRKTVDGEKNMFSGLLKCPDCGGNLNYHFNQGNHDIKYFNCANYNSRRQCVSTHYVRVDFLEQVVLGEIRRLTQFASRYESDFVMAAIGQSQRNAEAEREALRRELKALQKRDAELDNLFERIYEDNVSGKLTDERFAKMSAKYEAEQAELSERVKALKAEFDKESDKSMTTDMFIATVRKYTRAKKLTQRMLNELVDYIEVYQAEKIDGVHVQKLKIHYNCVGSIEIPNVLPLPAPEVLIQTRKGVAVSYSQSQKVVNL